MINNTVRIFTDLHTNNKEAPKRLFIVDLNTKQSYVDTKMKREMKMYALRNKTTGKLMGFSVSSNHDEHFCSDMSYNLQTGYGNIWVVNDRKVAETAAVTDTAWYGADFNTPSNDYVGELEVVELVVNLQ